MVRTIIFSDVSPRLGTRKIGEFMRNHILAAMEKSELVEFDFKDVVSVSNSFSDECFAKLLFDFELDELKRRTTFVNTSPLINATISLAFKQRLGQQVLEG